MTADLNRLLDEFEECVRDAQDGEHIARQPSKRAFTEQNVKEARAAIHSHFDRRQEGEDAERLSARITEYLCAGGLWNPESMEHDKVRRLLIDCRTAFDVAIADSAINAAIAQVDAARTEGKGNG